MKKKLGIVLSIMLAIVTMLSMLVSCTPKNTDTTTDKNKGKIDSAINEMTVLSDIFTGWLVENNWEDGAVMGWDVNADFTTDVADVNDLAIVFKGGINNAGDDLFEIKVINKSFEDKVEFGIQVLANQIHITVAGANYTSNEIGINDFADINIAADGTVSKTIDTMVTLLSSVVAGGVTINSNSFSLVSGTENEDGAIYDVTSDIDINIYQAIEGVLGSVTLDNKDQILDAIKPILGNVIINMNVVTNNRVLGVEVKESSKETDGVTDTTKVYVYKLSTGTVDKSAFNIKVAVGDDVYSVKVNNMQIGNTMPTVVVPEISTEIFLLKHTLDGSIVSKNTEGKIISKYDYELNVEFSAQDLIQAVLKSIEEKSAVSVIDLIFASQEGKLYFDLSHDCATSEVGCNGHMTTTGVVDTNFNNSLISIAYDKSSFTNKNIYGSVNIAGLLPGDFKETLSTILTSLNAGVSGDLAWSFLQTYMAKDVSFVIDPLMLKEYYTTGNITVDSIASVAAEEKPEFDIGSIISKIDFGQVISGLVTNLKDGVLDIESKSIRDLVAGLKLEGTTATVVDSLLDLIIGTADGVDSISINANYLNGNYGPANIRESFVEGKDFTKGESTAPIGSDVVYKTTNESVHIFGEKDMNYDLQDADGNILPFTHDELMSGVGGVINRYKSRYVKGTYTDILGNEVEKNIYIMEIKGLDETLIDVEQEITLILSRGTGNGIIDLLDNLLPILVQLKVLPTMPNIAIPELAITTKITLRNYINEGWSQDHIAEGIRLDETKEYNNGDKVGIEQRYVRKYSGNTKVEFIPTISYEGIDSSNNDFVFSNQLNTIDGATINYCKNVIINYNVVSYAGAEFSDTKDIIIKTPVQGEINIDAVCTRTLAINATSMVNPITDKPLDSADAEEFEKCLDTLQINYPKAGITYVIDEDAEGLGYLLSFGAVDVATIYSFDTIGIRGDSVKVSITVIPNTVVGYKAAFTCDSTDRIDELNASTEINPYISKSVSSFLAGVTTNEVYADGTMKKTATISLKNINVVYSFKQENGTWLVLDETNIDTYIKIKVIGTFAYWTSLIVLGDYRVTYTPTEEIHGVGVDTTPITIYVQNVPKD